MKSKEERLKKNTQDLMVFLFSQEIYKKNTQDLNKQLYIAYKKIKDLTDRLNGIKVQESNKEKEKFNLKPKFFVPEHGENKGKKLPCYWHGFVRSSHPEAWKGEE